MVYLVDTNVLVRFADREDPRNAICRRVIAMLHRRHELRTSSQNLVEMWNVLTRPADRNGFGKSPSEAESVLDLVEGLFPPLEDPPNVHRIWRQIVSRFGVSGVKVHDARLVAFMIAHDVSRILTFNGKDFLRFAEFGIEAVAPDSL